MGDKPFTNSLKVVFEAADKLYRTKLRPYLLLTHSVSEEDIEQYTNRPDSLTDQELRGRVKLFVGDNRIVGTLLLSALAPSVPALSDLTIRRLSALNYGSVVAPIPGREYGILKNKVAEWAGRFPEIKETGTDSNPGVRLELSGVDVDSVIANANVNDNPGSRSALAKRLLAEELGITQGQLIDELHFVWRGTERSVEVIFGNVADEDELADHDLMPQLDGRWRIAIDLPFDESEYGPVEDANRMRRLREKQGEPSRTVAWLPTHLSSQRYADFHAAGRDRQGARGRTAVQRSVRGPSEPRQPGKRQGAARDPAGVPAQERQGRLQAGLRARRQEGDRRGTGVRRPPGVTACGRRADALLRPVAARRDPAHRGQAAREPVPGPPGPGPRRQRHRRQAGRRQEGVRTCPGRLRGP